MLELFDSGGVISLHCQVYAESPDPISSGKSSSIVNVSAKRAEEDGITLKHLRRDHRK